MSRIVVVAMVAMFMMMFCSQGQCQSSQTTTSKATATTDSTEADTLVTGIDKDAFLKELQVTPIRQEACDFGWAMTNNYAKKGEVFQLGVAVCASRETAQQLYMRRVMLLSPQPRSLLGNVKVGKICTIGTTWAFLVRDNVFVSISWKDTVVDARRLTNVDKVLMTASRSVSRGQFETPPRLKDVPEEILITAGQTKDIRVTCEGMGKAPVAMWVSSPGAMSNQVMDTTVRLKVRPAAKGDRYPVTVCAVGEGLAFATATIEMVIRPATTQPATSQATTRPTDTAPSTQPRSSGDTKVRGTEFGEFGGHHT